MAVVRSRCGCGGEAGVAVVKGRCGCGERQV